MAATEPMPYSANGRPGSTSPAATPARSATRSTSQRAISAAVRASPSSDETAASAGERPPAGASGAVSVDGGPSPSDQRWTTGREPSRSAARQARRWILPLVVLGMPPVRKQHHGVQRHARARRPPRRARTAATIADGSSVARWRSTSRHHHQPLLAARALDSENAALHRRAEGRMARLGGALDVLRVVVAAAQDDQVLEPAGDEQLAVRCRNPRSPVRRNGPVAGAGQARAERLARLLRPVPVAARPRSARPPRSRPPRRGAALRRVSGSTIATRCPPSARAAAHQLARRRPRRPPPARSRLQRRRRRNGGADAAGSPGAWPPVTISVASARP